MSDDILGLIDGALRDYATSSDAMRWTPEPAEPETGTGRIWHGANAEIIAADLINAQGIVTALPPQPPREPGQTLLDDLRDLAHQLRQDPYEQPLPARIEVDDVAFRALRALATHDTEPWRHGGAGAAFGVPIHINPRLPRGGWRVVDRHGNVLREGYVSTRAGMHTHRDPELELAAGCCRITHGDRVLYEGPIGEWPTRGGWECGT